MIRNGKNGGSVMYVWKILLKNLRVDLRIFSGILQKFAWENLKNCLKGQTLNWQQFWLFEVFDFFLATQCRLIYGNNYWIKFLKPSFPFPLDSGIPWSLFISRNWIFLLFFRGCISMPICILNPLWIFFFLFAVL
jgi:hypothetical protein